MIEGRFIAFGRALGFAFRDELVELAFVLGLSERYHAATVAHEAENVASFG